MNRTADDAGRAGALLPEDAERFFSMSRSLFCVIDEQGVVLRLSTSWEKLLGVPLTALVGRHFADLLHPDDVQQARERFELAAREEHAEPPVENRYLRADGSTVWLRWDTHPVRDSGTVWCIARDVTSVRRQGRQQEVVADLGRRALEGAEVEDLLQATVEGVARGLELPFVAVTQRVDGTDALVLRASIGLTRSDGTLVDVPPGRATVSGRAMASGRPEVLVDTADPGAAYSDSLQQLGLRSVVSVAIGRPGAVWGALTAADRVVRAFDEVDVRFLEQTAHVLASAIERREVEDRLQEQATHDSLTGLPNRELLRERVDQALREARRTGAAVGMLLCDLDGFKDINDSLGHSAGDEVLRQLGQRLLGTVNADSTVARLGGDEFALCVVGPRTELEVLGVADDVVRAMRQPFALPGLEVPLSTSIGVAVSPTHGRDASTLLRHADVAMYRAKSRRLGWALYDASVDAARSDRLAFTSELRSAIVDDELELHYQPVVDLETGELRSVEALCRWHSPLRGEVPPTAFIPLAEQTGVILPLTAWVVASARAQAQRWWDAGHPVRCAVNLSMAAVMDAAASEALLQQLAEAAPLLTVEITESWLADARGREVVAELAATGVELALDDFGTGWSSLASLRSFPVRRLKLDRQFVLDLDEDDRGQDLLKAVSDLAGALGMDVVAEGVEQSGTALRLRAAGVRLGQGFLWSRPVPAAQLACWAGWDQQAH